MTRMIIEKVTWYIIHMKEAIEREDLVKNAEEMFGAKRFESVKGDEVFSKYAELKHPLATEKVSKGMMGCTESHLQLLKRGLESDSKYLGILEDDVVFSVDKKEIEEWLEQLPYDWDIALVGTNENVRSSPINSKTMKVTRFWGTHAFIVRKESISKIIRTYDLYTNVKKIACIADWWYSWAIQENNLNAYAPTNCNKFCKQKEGFVSYITGKIRS
jgi:GR25 family glycosyltransferase involved in LPS biosynthesis